MEMEVPQKTGYGNGTSQHFEDFAPNHCSVEHVSGWFLSDWADFKLYLYKTVQYLKLDNQTIVMVGLAA